MIFAALTGAILAQTPPQKDRKPSPPVRKWRTPREWEADSLKRERAILRQDFSYVPLGWTRRDPRLARIAWDQVLAQSKDPQVAMRLLEANRKRFDSMSREETLRCLVALRADGVRRPETLLFAETRRAIVARANRWRADLTLEEYKWRTLAQALGGDDKPLVPAFDRLLIAEPGDWYVNLLGMSAMISARRYNDALSIARRLGAKYPQHAGTLVEVSRTFSGVGELTRRKELYAEAQKWLDRAGNLPMEPRVLAEWRRNVKVLAYLLKKG